MSRKHLNKKQEWKKIMKNIKKYKLINPKRFVIFISTVILVIVYISALFHIKTITETKINKNLEISEKLQNSINEFNPDIVFHLAAQPLVRLSYSEPISTYKTK